MAHNRFPFLVLLALLANCGGGGNVEPPAPHATKLALSVQPPAQAQSGVNLAPPPGVQLQDDQGAAVAQAGVPVTVAIASGGGSLTGSTTVNTSAAGLATFTGLAIHGAVGSQSLIFSAADLTAVTSGTIELSAGAAGSITGTAGDQQTAGPGTPVAIAPSVTVTDGDHNPVAGIAVDFQVTAGGGTVDPSSVSTDANGVAAVAGWTLGPAPGPNSLTATTAAIPGSSVVFTAAASANVATISGTISVSNRLLGQIQPALGIATSRAAGAKTGLLQAHQFRSRALRRPGRSAPSELVVTYRPVAIGAPSMGARALASRSLGAAITGAIRTHAQAHLSAQASAVTGVSPTVMAARIRVRNPGDMANVAAALRSDPAVATVEPNGLVFRDATTLAIRSPNDRLYPEQAWHYGMIDLPEAWAITTGSASVLVGVVDDGIRFDHPDIAANLTSDGYDFVSNDFTTCSANVDRAGDGDGYDPDPTVPAVCDGGADSIGGHGLHVAGTIGAVGNDGVGATGVNWTVKIRPVRVLDIDGAGTDYDVAQGILYAAGLPADDGKGGTVQATSGVKVINLSLGGPTTSKVIHDAVIAATNAGVLIVAAAGNDGTSDPSYPAAFPEVLSVSAVGPDGKLASYSSFGSTIDIAAPGGDFADGDATFGVLSLIWDFKMGRPAYAFADGTSMATPHVTGVAALLLAQNPTLSPSDLKSRLTSYAVDAGTPGKDDKYGAGIVNARNSLTQTLAPARQLRARLYDASTGSILQTVAATVSRSYTFSGITTGSYQVFAGEDEDGDQMIGIPGRRWGGFGGSASPTSIDVGGGGTHHASFSIGRPAEQEPNDRSAEANLLVLGGYLTGETSPTDNDSYRVLIPQQGQYTFETSPVDGACGFALEEDTVIGVFDAQGTALGSNDDINQAADSLCSRVTLTLAPGRYRVDVQGLNGGAYRIQARAGP